MGGTDARTPVCLSFDVDAEAPWRVRGPGEEANHNLSQLSWGGYGIKRGLPRILTLLSELDAPSTFFVPGLTVDAHPRVIEEIAEEGHEVAHHGFHHFPPAMLSRHEQELEIDRGLQSIRNCIGREPVGYRAPAWQMTQTTLDLLCQRDFMYDSSMMADDRPYLVHLDNAAITEIPVHWGLDDVPYFAADGEGACPMRDPRSVFEVWWLEVESANAEGRATSFCFHPEVIGRAWIFACFERFIRQIHDDPRLRFSRFADLAGEVGGIP